MAQEITPPDDDHKIRCRKLGHLIYFSYCRTENDGLPCIKTLDCWFPHFSVEAFLRDKLTPEEFAEAFAKVPKPKVLSLVELIERAQKNTKK